MPKCTTTTTIPAFLGDGRVLLALKTAWADGLRTPAARLPEMTRRHVNAISP